MKPMAAGTWRLALAAPDAVAVALAEEEVPVLVLVPVCTFFEAPTQV